VRLPLEAVSVVVPSCPKKGWFKGRQFGVGRVAHKLAGNVLALGAVADFGVQNY